MFGHLSISIATSSLGTSFALGSSRSFGGSLLRSSLGRGSGSRVAVFFGDFGEFFANVGEGVGGGFGVGVAGEFGKFGEVELGVGGGISCGDIGKGGDNGGGVGRSDMMMTVEMLTC